MSFISLPNLPDSQINLDELAVPLSLPLDWGSNAGSHAHHACFLPLSYISILALGEETDTERAKNDTRL